MWVLDIQMGKSPEGRQNPPIDYPVMSGRGPYCPCPLFELAMPTTSYVLPTRYGTSHPVYEFRVPNMFIRSINDNVMQPTTMPRQFGMRIHQSCNMTPHTNHNQLDAKETKHSSTWGKFSSCNRMVLLLLHRPHDVVGATGGAPFFHRDIILVLPVKVHPFAGSDCSDPAKGWSLTLMFRMLS